MKKLKKLSLKQLEGEMVVIQSQEKLKKLTGGQYVSHDCVIKAFDYLDGPVNNYNMYQQTMSNNLGYNTLGSVGGVKLEHLDDVGAYGGLSVNGYSGQPLVNSTGQTLNGENVMMTFNGANGNDHAVVITGVNPNGSLNYYDPTTGQSGSRSSGDYSGLYIVGSI